MVVPKKSPSHFQRDRKSSKQFAQVSPILSQAGDKLFIIDGVHADCWTTNLAPNSTHWPRNAWHLIRWLPACASG